ncbi:MAG: hypothetical protein IT436_17070 [Phycisphaerales bacterium]|nr:hypothetical protein [Phycisphaerales bacterium]
MKRRSRCTVLLLVALTCGCVDDRNLDTPVPLLAPLEAADDAEPENEAPAPAPEPPIVYRDFAELEAAVGQAPEVARVIATVQRVAEPDRVVVRPSPGPDAHMCRSGIGPSDDESLVPDSSQPRAAPRTQEVEIRQRLRNLQAHELEPLPTSGEAP